MHLFPALRLSRSGIDYPHLSPHSFSKKLSMSVSDSETSIFSLRCLELVGNPITSYTQISLLHGKMDYGISKVCHKLPAYNLTQIRVSLLKIPSIVPPMRDLDYTALSQMPFLLLWELHLFVWTLLFLTRTSIRKYPSFVWPELFSKCPGRLSNLLHRVISATSLWNDYIKLSCWYNTNINFFHMSLNRWLYLSTMQMISLFIIQMVFFETTCIFYQLVWLIGLLTFFFETPKP